MLYQSIGCIKLCNLIIHALINYKKQLGGVFEFTSLTKLTLVSKHWGHPRLCSQYRTEVATLYTRSDLKRKNQSDPESDSESHFLRWIVVISGRGKNSLLEQIFPFLSRKYSNVRVSVSGEVGNKGVITITIMEYEILKIMQMLCWKCGTGREAILTT